MAVDVDRRRVLAPRRGVSLRSRLYGLGSVYAKTLRDSRLTFLIMTGLLAGLMLVACAGVGSVYATTQARADLARLGAELVKGSPALVGLVGNPVNIGTVGGYVLWKYGPVFLYAASIWSIMALSGTLASEARRGSLDMVATTSLGRRRLAIDKLAGHVTVLAVVMALMGLAAWAGGTLFASLPGDRIPPAAAFGYALWLGLVALATGSVAFALASLVGRVPAAWVAAVVLVGGYLLNGYRASVPALAGVADLSWFSWTGNHMPLAGRYDWPSLVPVAIVSVALLAIGVELFARRDLGATNPIRTPALPDPLLGLRGAIGRSFADRAPTAVAWALGLGLFGFVFAAASGSLATGLAGLSPSTQQVFRTVLPDFDLTSAGGFLELIYIQLGFVVVGFAASTLVAGWGSDEGSGRLEMLLATPLARRAWAARGAAGVFLAIVAMTIVLAAAVGLGALAAGSDAVTPAVGSITLGLYAAALAGVGFAVGGVFRTSIAAEIVALIVVATLLVDLVAPALKLPDWVHQLALTAHLGRPMVGRWDATGVIACLAIAIAGAALGAWGMGRRDVAA